MALLSSSLAAWSTLAPSCPDSDARDADVTLAPFELLWSAAEPQGVGLPVALRDSYGGDWRLGPGAPHVYVNFVASRDGRVSFGMAGHDGGGDVSGFDLHDSWLMGLLRARADAVLVGAGTLRAEPEHEWTAAFIAPGAADGLAALRVAEARETAPLQVVVSASGSVPRDAAVVRDPALALVVATTHSGARRARDELAGAPGVEVVALALPALLAWLARERGVRTLLCEGGARLYGALLALGLVHEEFLTLSPLVLGDAAGGTRPSLVEGVAFAPGTAPRSRLLSVRRAGDLLFLRSRYGGDPGPPGRAP